MATLFFSTLRSQLDNDLRDADNFTFTSQEKDEALRKAIEDDPDCFNIEIDTSNTTTALTSTYDTPYVNTVDVGIDWDGNGFVMFLNHSDWEQVGSQVILSRKFEYFPEGKTMYLYGSNQFSEFGVIPSTHRAYIMNNAVINTLEYLMEGSVNRFLRNDTTMAEIQAVYAARMAKVNTLRTQLNNRRSIKF